MPEACPECGADLETEERDAIDAGFEFVVLCRKRGDDRERVLTLTAAYFDFLEKDDAEWEADKATQAALPVGEAGE